MSDTNNYSIDLDGAASLYPFCSRYLERSGLRQHFIDEGSGDPLVMVHGNPTWSFAFRNLIVTFRERQRVLAMDHIGCGLSDKPTRSEYPFTLERRIDDLEVLLEEAGVSKRLTLLVHDWGGMIGLGYATRHPERIGRLIILNTSGFHLPKSKRFPWSLRLARDTAFGRCMVVQQNAFVRAALRFCVTRTRLDPDVRRGYLAPHDRPEHRLSVLEFVRDIPLTPTDFSYRTVSEIESNLPSLSHIPMLICWGMRDFVFDHHFFDEWRRRFPNAEVHCFRDAGHFLFEDVPNELIDRVDSFLARTHPDAVAEIPS